MSTVYMVQVNDGMVHAARPMANTAVCGARLGATGEVVVVLDSGDVPLTGTCSDCIKALDDEE